MADRNNEKVNSWCFTDFSTTNPNELFQTDALSEHVKAASYQIERCPRTNRLHFQGWIYLNRSQRRRWVSAHIFKGQPHLEKARGDPASNLQYTTKEETREPGQNSGPYYHPDIDTVIRFTRTNQGRRTDLEAIAASIEGRDVNELLSIADNHGGAYIRYHRGIQNLWNLRSSAEASTTDRDLEVHIIWGDPGVGKTRRVYEEHGYGNVYRLFSYSPEWWDGYSGQKVLLLDDFYGQLPLSRMLNILDRYPLQVSIKASSTWARYTKVYITSNTNWTDWYRTAFLNPRSKAAFRRRITSITKIEIPEEPLVIDLPEENDIIDLTL